jgi:hypothetical protein
VAAQDATALRLDRGPIWAFFELRKDLVGEHRRVLDEFVEPFIKACLNKENAKEADTLLDHLVRQTTGESSQVKSSDDNSNKLRPNYHYGRGSSSLITYLIQAAHLVGVTSLSTSW